MAVIAGGVVLGGFCSPTDSLDEYPVVIMEYAKGSLRTVADTVARDAIPAPRREEGMLVYCIADGVYYQLGNDLLTWIPFSGSAAGGAGSGELIDMGDRVGPGSNTHIIDGGLRV